MTQASRWGRPDPSPIPRADPRAARLSGKSEGARHGHASAGRDPESELRPVTPVRVQGTVMLRRAVTPSPGRRTVVGRQGVPRFASVSRPRVHTGAAVHVNPSGEDPDRPFNLASGTPVTFAGHVGLRAQGVVLSPTVPKAWDRRAMQPIWPPPGNRRRSDPHCFSGCEGKRA